MTTKMFIDGGWTASGGRPTFATYDPATGKVLEQVIKGHRRGRRRRGAGRRPRLRVPGVGGDAAGAARAKLLLDVADLIEAHAEELARLETINQGQPLAVSGGFAVPNAVELFPLLRRLGHQITGVTVPVSVPGVDYRTRREPLGVCALITPWNFPLMILAWKLAPALATGNTVVIKPAEQTPLSTLRLVELIEQGRRPARVVNVVTGGPGTGRALVEHPLVAKVSFTGSTEVGRQIGAVAGRALKRVSLELGGKAPSILAPDADIDAVIQANLMGGVLNSGQVCAAYTRFYVPRRRAAEFAGKLAAQPPR